MKDRFRTYRRKRGVFYLLDTRTGKRESLHTKDRVAASHLARTRNEAHQQPALSLQKARIYLMESDPAVASRTWQHVMDEMVKTKQGETLKRWLTAVKDKALDRIRRQTVIATQAEQFFAVLEAGTVSTNLYLRRMHNFALDMNWLPCPVIPRRQWPKIQFKEKRAITWGEHQKIVARETNPERKAFYELCWHLGGSQSDIAQLKSEDIDWRDRTLGYSRKKTKTNTLIHFGEEVEQLLRSLPCSGTLFPYLSRVRAGDRATEFKQRCEGLGIQGVSLHSYRYAWPERARTCGYPERFAQEALGHNSKAVHRAYAKKAQVKIPSLEEYEKKIVPVEFPKGKAV